MTESETIGMYIKSESDLAAINDTIKAVKEYAQSGEDIAEKLEEAEEAAKNVEGAVDDMAGSLEDASEVIKDTGKTMGEMAEEAEDAREQVNDLGEETKETGEKGKKGFDMLLGAAMGLLAGGALTQIAGQIGEVVQKVMDFVSAGVEWGQTVQDISRQTGLSTEAASRFAVAVQSIGTDTDIAKESLVYLAEALNEAQQAAGRGEEWAGPVSEAFEALGLNAYAADGQIRPIGDLLPEIADALAALPDPAMRTGTAIQIFGGQAAELLPLLEDGAAGLEEMMQRADELGLVLDEKGAKKAEEFNRTMAELQQAGEAVKINISTALIPVLQSLADILKGPVMQSVLGVVQGLGEVAQLSVTTGKIEDEINRLKDAAVDAGEAEYTTWEKFKKSMGETFDLGAWKDVAEMGEYINEEMARIYELEQDLIVQHPELEAQFRRLAGTLDGSRESQLRFREAVLEAEAAIEEEERAAAMAALNEEMMAEKAGLVTESLARMEEKASGLDLYSPFVVGEDGVWRLDEAMANATQAIDTQYDAVKNLQNAYEEAFGTAVFGVEEFAERMEGLTGQMERGGDLSVTSLHSMAQEAENVAAEIAAAGGAFPEEEIDRFMGDVEELRDLIEASDIGGLAKQQLLDMLADAETAVQEAASSMTEAGEKSVESWEKLVEQGQDVIGTLEDIERAAAEAAARTQGVGLPGGRIGGIPEYQGGGRVRETGIALLHRDEEVLSQEEARRYRAGDYYDQRQYHIPVTGDGASPVGIAMIAREVLRLIKGR